MSPEKKWPPALVSVIIPNLNGASTIGEELAALESQTYRGRFEVIVSDNGSTDDSVRFVESWDSTRARVRLAHAERRGVGSARNVGAAAAAGDFLVFCDADDIVASNWLEAMVDASREHDVVGGLIEIDLLNPDAKYPRPRASSDHLPMILGRYRYAPGGNCGVWRHVWEALRGWNEDFDSSTEDEEFSIRATLAGYSVGFAPEAVIHYRFRDNLRSFVRQQFLYGMEEVHLYREFRSTGVSHTRLLSAVRAWLLLIWHVPDVFHSGKRRADWLRKGASRLGHLWGSMKYRTLYL